MVYGRVFMVSAAYKTYYLTGVIVLQDSTDFMFEFLVAFLLFFLAGVFSFLDASVTVVIIGIVLHILHRVIDGLINCCFNMVSLIAECRIRFLSILLVKEWS